MRDIDKLLALLEATKLDESVIEEILIGNKTLVISWNEDGSIKYWGTI